MLECLDKEIVQIVKLEVYCNYLKKRKKEEVKDF